MQLWIEATDPVPLTEPTFPPIAASTAEAFTNGQVEFVGDSALAAAASALDAWAATDRADEAAAAELADSPLCPTAADPIVRAVEDVADEDRPAASGLDFAADYPEAQAANAVIAQKLTAIVITRT